MHQNLPIAPDFLPESLHREFEHFANVYTIINLIRYLFPKHSIEPKYFAYKKDKGAIVILDFGEFPGTFE